METGEIFPALRDATARMAGRMNFPLEEERLKNLCLYVEELARWNKAYNLVGRRVGPDGLVELCLDAITPLCFNALFGGDKEVLDMGTGAGMPGIPLYILAGPFPLTLVEAQRKKITFLRHVKRKLGFEGITIYPGRIEDMCREDDHLNAYEIVLTRAAMEPDRAVRYARPLLCDGGHLLLFVGEADAERLRREASAHEGKGMKVKAIRSTKRFTTRENYLVQMVKTST